VVECFSTIETPKPRKIWVIHLLGQVARSREFIGIPELQESRIRDQENPGTVEGVQP
jgi:hypothetical protein